MKTIELIEYGDPVTTTDADGNETTERPVTVLQCEDVEDEKYQSTYRRLKLQSELDNEGLSERRYNVREKKEE